MISLSGFLLLFIKIAYCSLIRQVFELCYRTIMVYDLTLKPPLTFSNPGSFLSPVVLIARVWL